MKTCAGRPMCRDGSLESASERERVMIMCMCVNCSIASGRAPTGKT